MNAVVDRVVQYPHRYQLKNVNTGEVLGTFDLEPITGTISVVGTKIDKELFDSIASDLSARLVANGGDLKDTIITFSMASTRSNVASGEKLSVSFGKIAKYFNDLKAVAFSGDKRDIDLGNVDNTSDKDKPVSNATQQALNLKANASDVYSKTETDGLLNNKANTNDVYSKTKTDELLNNKANKSDVYTKTETDNGINKSLYNLGYYDTITANSDGTYTITRQTGYIVLDGVKNKITDKNSVTTNGLFYNLDIKPYVEKPSSNANVGNIICNRFGTKSFDYLYFNNAYGVALNNTGAIFVGLTTAISTIDEANAYLVQNPIYIQYKLATSYTEKVEANHYARYNERFILDNNKTEAERSANLFNINDIGYDGGGYRYFIIRNATNGKYTLSSTYTSDNGRIEIFKWSGSGNPVVLSPQISIHNINNVTFETNEIDNTYKYLVFYLSVEGNYSFDFSSYNVMLNVGDKPLSYQPYEGKVVHEKGLGDYLPLTGGVINANNTKTPLILKGGVGNYREGLRIIPTATWATILLGGSDVQEDGGTSNNSWVIANNDGNLYISKNNTDSAIKLSNTGGTWKVNDNKTLIHEGNIGGYLKTINGNSIVGSGDLSITPGIFTKLGNKTNFSFDSGSYLVVANNGLVDVTGTDPLNVGSSAFKKYLGIFMVTIAEYDGGQSLRVNTEQVFFADYVSGTISGPTFTIYKLN